MIAGNFGARPFVQKLQSLYKNYKRSQDIDFTRQPRGEAALGYSRLLDRIAFVCSRWYLSLKVEIVNGCKCCEPGDGLQRKYGQRLSWSLR